MGRKKISTYKLNKIKDLLNTGKTSAKVAEVLKVSVATVSNYRGYFKKKGLLEIVKNKNAPKKEAVKKERVQENKKSVQNLSVPRKETFTYVINGTELSFNCQPKSLVLEKNKFIIEL